MHRSFVIYVLICSLAIPSMSSIVFAATQASTREELLQQGVDPNSQLRSEDIKILGKEQWYPYLVSRSSQGDTGGRISKLNPTFASNLMRVLQAAEAAGFRPVIVSGYRSVEHQAKLYAKYKNGGPLAAPPGRSRHNYGLAADVDSKVRDADFQKWMHKNSPPYGVYNPPAIRSRDGHHYQGGAAPKGGVVSVDDDTEDTSASSDGLLADLGNSLGNNSGSGVAGVSDTSYIPSAYEIFVDEIGPFENEDYIVGEETSAFDRLLNEFNEVSNDPQQEVKLEYDTNTQTSPETINANEQSIKVDSSNNCEEGVVTRNVYGNLVCMKNIVSNPDSTTVEGVTLIDIESEQQNNKPVRHTVLSFVESILPTRYLIGDIETELEARGVYTMNNAGQKFEAYDAFQPLESIAYGTNQELTLREDIERWLSQDEISHEEVSLNSPLFSVAISAVRPIFLHAALTLFGPSSQVLGSLLEFASNIQE